MPGSIWSVGVRADWAHWYSTQTVDELYTRIAELPPSENRTQQELREEHLNLLFAELARREALKDFVKAT